MKENARIAWAALTVTLVGGYLVFGRRPDPRTPEVALWLAVVLVEVLVALLLSVLARRRRIGERLGVLPPGAGREPEDD